MYSVSQVKDGGYDHRVNETVNVVTQKTSEIGHRTWGIMKGVMALATQKVEEYTRENNWKTDNWQQNENDRNDYFQEYNRENKGRNPSSGGGQPSVGDQMNTHNSSSWDDWDSKDTNKVEPARGSSPPSSGGNFNTHHTSSSWDDWDNNDTGMKEPAQGSAPRNNNDSWTGWEDDAKDDEYDNSKAADHNGKSGDSWSGGGFH